MYVAIVKRIKDLETKDALQQYLPDDYPVQCEEFATEADARARYPEAEVITTAEYNSNASKLLEIFESAVAAKLKPWWKFW